MQTKIKEEKVINGKTLRLYQLKNRNNTTIEICNYGARITRIIFNDIFSNPVDIVCGFNNVEDFITKDNPYFNAVIGRVCNRIENAKFKLNKVEYNLCANNGKNSLHGGNEGFDKKYWTSEIENGRLKMSYISKDGEENYPGNLKIAVYYFLSEQDELEIEYEYSSDQDTIVNLTNHAYFNLNGDFSMDVTNHILKINSSKFSAVDESLIPIQSKSVEGTPFDFRNYKQIGKDINNDDIQLKYGNGYDHNFILDNKNYDECVCQIFSPISQIKMEVFTDMPCMQFYTANGLETEGREVYKNRTAFCLETQKLPNAINTDDYEQVLCRKDEQYNYRTKYAFSLMKEDFNLDGKILVDELITYAKKNLYTNKLDEIYLKNLLLTTFKLDSPLNYELNKSEVIKLDLPDTLIKHIQSYALRQKLVQNYNDSCKFASYVFGILTPLPSKINNDFYYIKDKYGIEKATDYFYNLCIKNDYIKKTMIDKNIKWEVGNGNRKLEITINLSKPEKSNKDIAKLVKVQNNTNYPLCPLCKENEGFYGSSKIQPRTNIRTISLSLNNEEWFMQYSPYAYFEEHCICINKKHTKMDITTETLYKLFDFIKVFPNYFIGSNASLPLIGGSILNHEHFQGGKHLMPIFSCDSKMEISQNYYPNTKVQILDWYNSIIKLVGKSKDEIINCGGKIINSWKNYENKKLHIINKSDGELHNSLSPILRINENKEFELYMILRNNIQTNEYPEGYFHAHPEYHNIKKEGIGLIEAMGLFILPARLQNQLSLIASILCKEIEYDPQEIQNPNHYLYVHRDMIEYLYNNFSPDNYQQAKRIVMGRVNVVCENILKNTSVFKDNDSDFVNFIKKSLQ